MSLTAVVDFIVELGENADLDQTSAFDRLLHFLAGRSGRFLPVMKGKPPKVVAA